MSYFNISKVCEKRKKKIKKTKYEEHETNFEGTYGG